MSLAETSVALTPDAATKTAVIQATFRDSLLATSTLSGHAYDMRQLEAIFSLVCIPPGVSITFEEV